MKMPLQWLYIISDCSPSILWSDRAGRNSHRGLIVFYVCAAEVIVHIITPSLPLLVNGQLSDSLGQIHPLLQRPGDGMLDMACKGSAASLHATRQRGTHFHSSLCSAALQALYKRHVIRHGHEGKQTNQSTSPASNQTPRIQGEIQEEERTVPSASLTSSVANSQDNEGKLMLKLILRRSSCALLSTTSSSFVSRARKLPSSCTHHQLVSFHCTYLWLPPELDPTEM